MNQKELESENYKRRSEYFGAYNPWAGEGSLLERRLLRFDSVSIHLPESMFSLPLVQTLSQTGSVSGALSRTGMLRTKENHDLIIRMLYDLRLDDDFEFFCCEAVRIQDKVTKKHVPFVLNYPQRVLLARLEAMRLAGIPIRVVLVKARQWGGSTLVQMYMGWFQARRETGWHSIIMADVEDQARNIRGMYTKMAKYYPKHLGSLTLRPYEGSTKTRVITERECIVGVGSIQKPENTRSYDISMGHLSEVGLWKSTKTRSAEDLAQALAAAIPRKKNTLIVKESTAKGTGNYFHNEYIAAEAKKSGYAAVFIPWFFIPLYQEPIDDMGAFLSTMTEYDWWQWEQGATMEGIKWYREHKAAERYDDWRMKSEYPTTADEAFQSTGRRVFSPLYTLTAKKTCCEPWYIGELRGAKMKGKESLDSIEFSSESGGRLQVWAKPDTSELVRDRYCAFADIGGRTKGADYSVVKVFDRYMMMHGGMPEVVAVWRGHLDQDLFAWKAAQVAKWYNSALLAVEVNSLKRKGEEGDHSYTVLDQIADHYDNLFARTPIDQIRQGVPAKYGFHTGHTSKHMIMDTLNGALRDEAYIERSMNAYREMDWYEFKPDGTMGAVDGRNDDELICTAGGLWLAIAHMPMPTVITPSTNTGGRGIVGEASF